MHNRTTLPPLFPRFLPVGLAFVALLLGACAAVPSSSSPGKNALSLQLAPQTLRSDEATLVWEKPEGAAAGAIFEVLRDGKPVGTTNKTHFTATNLQPNHAYVFTVRAADPTSRHPATAKLALRTQARETVVSVLDHGAVGDGKTLNTKAIQAAIDACPVGGIVRIPEGVFLSGALFLKSDMTLEISKGGTLKGTADPKDYLPFTRNRFEGWEMETHASLLNAGTLDRNGGATLRNLSIRGEGTLSGGGKKLSDIIRKDYPGTPGLRVRGRLVLIMNAENVEIAGLQIEESPCWTLHYIYSKNVSLHGLTIRSHVLNGDGIDPDSSDNSFIFDCTFDTGDDCIAIKSGKNPEGNEVNRPTIGVRVFDCRFNRGHGISLGSEMSGGVRDVLVENCVTGDLLNGLQIKATEERGGFIENVTVRDCDLRMITIFTSLPYNNDGKAAPSAPYFKNFRFKNLDMSKANPAKPVIIVQGFKADGHETRDVTFENIKLPAGATVKISRSADLSFTNVKTTDGISPAYEISDSERIAH